MGLRHSLQRAQRVLRGPDLVRQPGRAPRGRALLYRLGRILYATVQGFREKHLNFRAAALTYYSVLSIVPFLAFAFSVLKGFGGYQRLMDQSAASLPAQTFGGNPSLLHAVEQMLSFVEKTSVAGLGMMGVLFLVYTSISLLSTIETALNEIWGAKSSRPLLRQVTDYTTLMVVTPLLARRPSPSAPPRRARASSRSCATPGAGRRDRLHAAA